MTVSTSGILPGILDFANETVRPKLAVSLNASNDQVREAIMPITRKWNIAALLEAARNHPSRANASGSPSSTSCSAASTTRSQHADEVIALSLRGIAAKVNLIVWNSGPDMPYTPAHNPRT